MQDNRNNKLFLISYYYMGARPLLFLYKVPYALHQATVSKEDLLGYLQQ